MEAPTYADTQLSLLSDCDPSDAADPRILCVMLGASCARLIVDTKRVEGYSDNTCALNELVVVQHEEVRDES